MIEKIKDKMENQLFGSYNFPKIDLGNLKTKNFNRHKNRLRIDLSHKKQKYDTEKFRSEKFRYNINKNLRNNLIFLKSLREHNRNE